MTSGAKTVTVFLTVLCGLLLTIVAICGNWPWWAWSALVALLLGVPLLIAKIAGIRSRSLPPELTPYLPPVPVERREEQISHVSLPSAWEDYDFLFSATVRWCPTGKPAEEPIVNPAGLAVEAVLKRARAITKDREPGWASFVQHGLSGALSRMQPEPTGHLQAMAEAITLTLSEHDQERLESLASVRKDKAVWEHQRKYEQSKREYLGDDVLKDTGSAVVWWLAKNDDQVHKTVEDLGLLAQLTSAANDTDVPERLLHLLSPPNAEDTEPGEADNPGTADWPLGQTGSTADHFDAFLRGMGLDADDVRRGILTRQIAEILVTQGRNETAEELLRRFDAPTTPFNDDFGMDSAAGDSSGP
ncbi:hypothetical protein [Streptomyces rapamycinicus]|uniref:Uncharacterized protein n=2 Tax=Streptomyces rapamycinicus TaxID=1226757 RepID=A0A0A0NSC7_STRRN|nr:hypothetical protein [Streptomyces rapamycinicus]AGP59263.1 hypothetical protein M271_39390 [Streptomyces rapamycinicus NRRL 5491]MBB4787013.1 hypothetical protein [Streptomyces rapamycinicus]RLV77539.1 hypothetical protein D3C57_104180 [Streptomyces rapamycinicus NRRL 5491]UTO67016.1 hypothetical protein LJB45_35030 [Streptomyces rapamycinicus]UTP34973.1 hypothetical protein LIV37_40165 [Streptomyces rapamycinicus NRRL 5491]